MFLRDLQFLCFIYLIYLLYFLLQSGLYPDQCLFPYQIAPCYNGLFQRTVDSFSTTVPKKSKYRVDAGHLQNLISYLLANQGSRFGPVATLHLTVRIQGMNNRTSIESKKA